MLISMHLNQSIQEVLFFPQMRPEQKAPTIELNDEEKAVLALIKKTILLVSIDCLLET